MKIWPIFQGTNLGLLHRDDAVGVAVAVNNALEELDGRWPVQLFDGFSFNPFRELVHGHQQVCVAATGPLQWADHVQSPDGKRPGDRDRLEC